MDQTFTSRALDESPITTATLLDALPPWQRREISRDHFGSCPRCENSRRLEIEDPPLYPVVNVDTFSYAVCPEHRTRWCLGYLQLGEPPYRYEAPDSERRLPNPQWLDADRLARATAAALLAWEDVTAEVAKQAFDPLGSSLTEAQLAGFTPYGATVPYAQMLGAFGLAARAVGVIGWLDADFMCYCDRDAATGQLVKITYGDDWRNPSRELVPDTVTPPVTRNP